MTTHRPSLEGSMTEGIRRRHTISVLDVSVLMESQALTGGTRGLAGVSFSPSPKHSSIAAENPPEKGMAAELGFQRMGTPRGLFLGETGT